LTDSAEDSGWISIDQFAQIDLRVGQVLVAERIPNADKLLRLEVELGEPEPRQLLAGIAEYYAPEQLVGQKILVVANLQPRRLRGLESRGMLLAASADDGRPLLATVPADTPNGARLR
jgi:methionyl-tRNA synthetase